ncbi:hypothetical protein [Companilactobacillus nantensis]|uniref:Uncharacterized protein n=1 Tax=Companilactobacillus nantensis DSM 16982 TaxID=1423774 RepID=A0A0R1WLY9_9LACO|nr:hypothetical protein [Companilactobacillus nantensis]KRM18437.1 hypothetical protein FD31_GL000984 [Companilactobacillus nantensis DSM 16982]GEO63007.1 hypothetical protein LNA01_01900 [Companilactobacillus nantensis]
MALTDWIQSVSAIVALIISTIAIVQTNRTIYDSNKPYISFFFDYIQVLDDVHQYIVVKNFGKTRATIKKVTLNPKVQNEMTKDIVFSHLEGTSLAPGQSFTATFSSNAFTNTDRNHLDFTIHVEYEDELHKLIKDDFFMTQRNKKDMFFTKSTTNIAMNETVSRTAEELLRKRI